ncbi:L,D-transpeptidase family protein [Candidatus Pelagibacter sp. Uisw_127]|uniref:L,D-transpeptidase family protein n=1 Tax=Candidatus Pelagibacter sp. Uisw_127 TaxID=3230988 RepID=UPI0039EBC4B1
MIIHVRNKNSLIIDDFTLKCCIGKNGLNSNKREGDLSTPKGSFKLKRLYFRKDRVGVPKCKIRKKIITKNMGWCDDSNNKKYNSEIIISKKNKEKFYRDDFKYDYLITINHNNKKIPFKGSAIFIHLTENYKPTAGCIALKKSDFEILLKLIDQNTKLKID